MGTAAFLTGKGRGVDEVIPTNGLAHVMDTHRKDYITIWTALSPGPTHCFPCLSWQPDLANKGRKGLRNEPKSPKEAWPPASVPLLPLAPPGCRSKDTQSSGLGFFQGPTLEASLWLEAKASSSLKQETNTLGKKKSTYIFTSWKLVISPFLWVMRRRASVMSYICGRPHSVGRIGSWNLLDSIAEAGDQVPFGVDVEPPMRAGG